VVASVIEPQLALYSLALEAMKPIDPDHRAPVRVTAAELDYLCDKAVSVWVDERQRKHWRKVLGAVLDHAREGLFLSLPHPDGCRCWRHGVPFCDFTEVCRLRPGFRIEAGEEENAMSKHLLATAPGAEVVVAPAGSGKTTLLIFHFLRLLKSGIPVERLVAITFTRKAAAELLQRLAHVLRGVVAPAELPREKARRDEEDVWRRPSVA